MSIFQLSGPVIHIGASAFLAVIFRLNIPIAVFCGVLPDLVDKPLAIFGIGGGRYVGHTLLFAVVITGLFFMWNKKYGCSALFGFMSHLFLDRDWIPWFYPFRDYEFSDNREYFLHWIEGYLSFSQFGRELLIACSLGIIILIFWWIYRYFKRRSIR